MFAFPSDVYSCSFGSGYEHYRRPAARPVDCRGSYYNPFADVRALESELLAQEAARREEEALERRLHELRRSRVPHSQSYSYDTTPYPSRFHDNWTHEPSSHLMETLRLQAAEEEQIARLEALRKRRLELEAEERMKVAAELRRKKLEAEELARREQAKRLRELAIAEEEEKLRQLIQRQKLTTKPVAKVLPRHQTAQSTYPPQRILRHTPHDVLKLYFDLPSQTTEQEPVAPSASASQPKEKRTEPQATPQEIDLAGFLQQLGLLPVSGEKPSTSEKKEEKQSGQQPAKPSASAPQLDSSAPTPPSKVPAAASAEVTLKRELEQRLEGEYANEVRDTILALLSSLEDANANNDSHPPASSSPPRPSPVASSKGKEKASAPSSEPTSPSTWNVKDAMGRLQEIESRFYHLENEFEFPGKLDFTPSSTPTAPLSPTLSPAPLTSRLAYTATNQPVRYYEQALSGLLTQLDSVESHGSEELRNRRKEVVRKVESALEDLEQRVETRWKASLKETKRRSVTIEDVTTPEEHLMIPENVPVSPLLLANRTLQVPESETAPSAQPQETEASGLVVEESTATSPEATEPSVPVHEDTTTEVASEAADSHPSLESLPQPSTESSADEASEPATTPVEEVSETPESLDDASIQDPSSTDSEHVNTSATEPSSPSLELETEPADAPTADSQAADLDNTLRDPAVAPSPQPEDDTTRVSESENDVSESQTDLSATIRPSSDITSDDKLVIPDALELTDVDSELSETEAEGLLLENGVVEATHDISDTESTSSEWSEVDAAASSH